MTCAVHTRHPLRRPSPDTLPTPHLCRVCGEYVVRSSRRWFRFSRSLTFVHFHDKYTLYSTLQHTQFSIWSMWSGQAAEGSRFDDQWSSWPPTRPSQPPAQPRSAAPWRTARAPARHHAAAARCRLHSHQKHLPRHRPPASCQPQSAAWGQAASGLSGTVREGTVGTRGLLGLIVGPWLPDPCLATTTRRAPSTQASASSR